MDKTRKLNALRSICFVFVSLIWTPSIPAQAETKPNMIFLFADDLGWGDLSCYGSEKMKTTSLDKLAKEGTLFTQFYVAGSVCSPSRAGIMSGQYPARNRVFGHFARTERNKERGMPNALDPDLFMLTDLLQAQDYITAHFGKWHLGNISPAEYGIDVFMSNAHSNVRGGEKLDIWSPKARPTSTKDVLDETMKFIEKNKNNPFYVNVWFSDVHATLNPSKEQLKSVPKKYKRINETVDFYGVEQVYLATLKEMDRQIGIFLNKLEDAGLAENTLVIFSSDNGPEDYQITNAAHSGVGSTGPFRGRKRSIYEGGIRVPFIIKWPGKIPANNINNTSVMNGVDFIPTVASIVNAKIPDNFTQDGEDMSDVWLGSERKREKTLFWEWRYRVFGHVLNRCPMIAVREGNYKLLMNPDKSRVELYNIIEDPSEMQNLVESNPEITKQLVKKALAWYKTIPESPLPPKAGKNDWNWPE